jgi:hypothetical protein
MWLQYIIEETILILSGFLASSKLPAKRKADLEALIAAAQTVVVDIQTGV